MEEYVWEQKFRPSTVAGTVLPAEIKASFLSFIEAKEIPNLILSGPSGVGKTTIALATINEMGCDYIKINASLKRGIDMIRDELVQFASTVSFNPGRKYVILDEADGISTTAQEALKAFIEEYSCNCGFILTVNNPNKIIPAIKSRCQEIDFRPDKDSFIELGKEFFESVCTILKKENIPYDRSSVVLLLKKYYPDWRQVLIQLQAYAVKHKKIDMGILGLQKDNTSKVIIEFLMSKKWTDMRQWVGENFAFLPEFHLVAGDLFKALEIVVKPACLSDLIVLINEYDYKNAFVMDKEINLTAFLTQAMGVIQWK